jgi:hypothetical protein
MKGYNVHGVFSNFASQTVALEGPVVFTNGNNINGLIPMDGTGTYTQIKIEEEGTYRLEFLCTTDTSAQFAIFINGIVRTGTIFGSNKGAGQIVIRNIIQLKKGDLVSINNHTSGGPVTLSQDAGGLLPGISALLQIVKITPPQCMPHHYKENKHCFEKMYCNFKKYLLMNKHLQLTGSEAYFTVLSSTTPLVMPASSVWRGMTLVSGD